MQDEAYHICVRTVSCQTDTISKPANTHAKRAYNTPNNEHRTTFCSSGDDEQEYEELVSSRAGVYAHGSPSAAVCCERGSRPGRPNATRLCVLTTELVFAILLVVYLIQSYAHTHADGWGVRRVLDTVRYVYWV